MSALLAALPIAILLGGAGALLSIIIDIALAVAMVALLGRNVDRETRA